MKKKRTDEQQASDLLQKLQAAVLASRQGREKKDAPDSDEQAFQKKLEGMLSRVTAQAPASKSKKKKKQNAETAEDEPIADISEEAPAEETPVEDAYIEAEPPKEEPAPKPPKPKKTKKKKATPPKKEEIPKDEEAPVEETPKDEPPTSTPSVIRALTNESEPSDESRETTEPPIKSRREAPSAVEILTEEEPAPIIVEEPTSAEEEPAPDTEEPTPVIEEPTPMEEEPTPEPPKEECPPRAEQPTKRPVASDRIVIPPPTHSDPPKPQRKETQAPRTPERIVIRPKPIDELEDAMQTRKNPKKADQTEQDAPIVIPPAPAPKQDAPIVIKPRGERRETPVAAESPSAEPKQNTPSTEPIRVSPDRKREPNVTQPPASRPAAPTRTANVTLPPQTPSPFARDPQAEEAPKAPIRKKPMKKRPDRINRTPITTLPEESDLDEVLEEMAADEDLIEELPVEEPEAVTHEEKKTPAARRREKRQREVEQTMAAVTLIEERTGLTEDDIAMIFELGYENDLGRLVGYETLKRLKYEHIRRSGRDRASQHDRTAFGLRSGEYTGEQAAEQVLGCYRKDKRRLILRLVFTALLALLLIPASIPLSLGARVDAYLGAHAWILPLYALICMAVAAVLSHRSLIAGFVSFFRFTPTPYSVNAILLPLSMLYALLSVFFAPLRAVAICLPAVCSLLLTAVADAKRLADEMRTFRLLTENDVKYLLDTAEPRKKKLRRGDRIVKILNDDVAQNLYRVRLGRSVSGFFRRCNDFSSSARPFTVLILTSLSLSFLGALAGAILGGSLSVAMISAAVTLLVTLPIPGAFLYFDTFCQTNRGLYDDGCALVGEGSADELADPKTLILRDEHMCRAKRCAQIAVREGEDFREDMRLAGILFRRMSAPLATVAGKTTVKGAEEPTVSFVRLTENGTEAIVDNHHLLAGNAAFLTRSGVRVPAESTDAALRRGKKTSLMYVAVDGSLKLSYEIEYAIHRDFEEMAARLADSDTAIAIQTYDPNLNESFLAACRPEDSEPVRVIKPGRYEDESVQEVSDSGAVALNSPYDTAKPVEAACRLRRFRRVFDRVQLLVSILSAAGGVALCVYGGAKLPLGVLTLAPLLFQAVVTTVGAILSHVRLRGEKPQGTSAEATLPQ